MVDISRTQHDEPFGLLDAVLVGLGVAEGGNGDLVGLFDLVGGTVADEDGLATPLDDDLFPVNGLISMTVDLTHVLALGNGVQVNLDLGHGQNIRGSRHIDKEFWPTSVRLFRQLLAQALYPRRPIDSSG